MKQIQVIFSSTMMPVHGPTTYRLPCERLQILMKHGTNDSASIHTANSTLPAGLTVSRYLPPSCILVPLASPLPAQPLPRSPRRSRPPEFTYIMAEYAKTTVAPARDLKAPSHALIETTTTTTAATTMPAAAPRTATSTGTDTAAAANRCTSTACGTGTETNLTRPVAFASSYTKACRVLDLRRQKGGILE